MKNLVTFWIPELLSKERLSNLSEEVDFPKLPWLSQCLTKADALPNKDSGFYNNACYLYHQPKTLPVAATSVNIELDDVSTEELQHFWLKIDPVQLIADRDTLILIPSEDVGLTEQESKSLLSSFNQHFLEDGLVLKYGDKGSWYLAILQEVDITTTSLDELSYHRLDNAFPKGNASSYWRKLLNEVQMLFFTHPVNEARREIGQPEINSVWVWGEGKLDFDSIVTRKNASIYSDSNYLAGLAQQCQSEHYAEPKNHQEWSANHQLDTLNSIDNHHDLICLYALSKSLPNLSQQEWLDLLVEIDNTWFKLFIEDLKQGKIDSLLIDVGLGNRYHLEPKHLKRFWRFNKSITKLLH